ncbi:MULTISPECIES: winged helix-turn-helix transcriptional regulator [unclassified Sphingobium]|uniref:winged helix-turn-helix transcriptional regulator n=1 Tax=unclassified Sphingobium TaxID=2611147 RepID=UPI001E53921D|nr:MULTISPECIES: helix-turn-helix domain-containing protein [unclassified Sphingobium]WIW90932.1 helix-turn-helix domain-containing protein [Sphingobium sp. V4]
MMIFDDFYPHARVGLAALAQDMADHGAQRDAPIRTIFGLLGDRWSMLVLLLLAVAPFRHAELRRLLDRLSAEGRISQRVLTLKLRLLERNGLVARSVSEDVPPKVGYALTPLGAELVEEARRLLGWVQASSVQINQARAAFDRMEDV